jgi:hypothetical protein
MQAPQNTASSVKNNKNKTPSGKQPLPIANKKRKTLTTCYRGMYQVCRDNSCIMKSSQYKQDLDPTKGKLYGRVCIECDTALTPKCFGGLMRVAYCTNVMHPDEYSGDEETTPHCDNVICYGCSLPKAKRSRKQVSTRGWNGNPV